MHNITSMLPEADQAALTRYLKFGIVAMGSTASDVFLQAWKLISCMVSGKGEKSTCVVMQFPH